MNANMYREIIYEYLIPFVGSNFNYFCNLHQDNDSKNRSKICQSVLYNFNINWVINKK